VVLRPVAVTAPGERLRVDRETFLVPSLARSFVTVSASLFIIQMLGPAPPSAPASPWDRVDCLRAGLTVSSPNFGVKNVTIPHYP